MPSKRSLIVASVLVLSVPAMASCGDQANQAAAGPQPLVIDTDVGSDDALALLYMLQDPGVDVLAVTVSGTGLVHCDSGVSIVAGLVRLTEHPPIPIVCGSEKPTSGQRAFPEAWRDQADGRYGNLLPAAAAPADGRNAVDLLSDVLRESKRDVTILTLGPLTNLAEAVRAHPDLVKDIDHVVAMAGAFQSEGNVSIEGEPAASASEWNVYVDPSALQTVLDTAVDVTFVPIDSQVPVDAYALRGVAETTSAAGKTAAKLLTSDPFFSSGAFFLWDPLAASAVIDHEFLTLRAAQVAVITDGAEAGRTTEGSGSKANIAVVGDTDGFLADFVATIDRKSEITPFSRVPTISIDAGNPSGCSFSATEVVEGPAVIDLPAINTVVAIGRLTTEKTDAEINAYLATAPTSLPEWFPMLTQLQAIGKPSATYIDLPLGTWDFLCIQAPTSALPTISGRGAVHISPS